MHYHYKIFILYLIILYLTVILKFVIPIILISNGF